MSEGVGSVIVTVSVQNGTLARGVSVVLETSLHDGTATGGILFVAFIFHGSLTHGVLFHHFSSL